MFFFKKKQSYCCIIKERNYPRHKYRSSDSIVINMLQFRNDIIEIMIYLFTFPLKYTFYLQMKDIVNLQH